ALPIVETKQGEIAAYIPTNLISITDGQIYLNRDLFVSGFRPAIDISLSVSRIGGKTQHLAIREQAGRMKLDYLQFLELENFSRFGQKLESSMEARIKRGRLLREILKQDRLMLETSTFQLAWLIAYNNGLLDHFQPSQINAQLELLKQLIQESTLTLNSDLQHWQQFLEDNLSGSQSVSQSSYRETTS
ncbi:MAG TPA: F0F1 ATP synthase subunit alpha, partial [Methylophaga sp.]|nr:F0F1 ATP synthase subunit alpha [Methylophaga sp.]